MTETPAVPPRPVLVARCENFIEGPDFDGTHCLGRIRFRWGQGQAACDTCGAYCGIAVAAWERVELARAVPDTGQDVFEQHPGTDARTFLQWKGTDVCIDVRCTCGAKGHLDGDFAYFVECPACGAVYEMGTAVKAIKLPAETEGEDYDAKLLDAPDPPADGHTTALLGADTTAAEPLYRYAAPRRTGQIANLRDDLTCVEEMIAAARPDYPGLPHLRRHRDELAAAIAEQEAGQ